MLAALSARRGADPAGDAGRGAVARPAQRAPGARDLVLGRQPPAAFGIVAGADGAVAGARGQCRRRHHGRNLQPDLRHLARWPARRRRLHQRHGQRAGRRHQGLAAATARSAGHPAGRPRRDPDRRRAGRDRRPARPRHLSGSLAAAAIGRQRLGTVCVPAKPALSASNWRGGCNLALGDHIELPTPGGNWPLEIVGIYADYGNPKNQVTVNIAALLRHFPAIPQTRMGLRVPPQNSGADDGAARQIRPRWPQPAGSGDVEGRIRRASSTAPSR